MYITNTFIKYVNKEAQEAEKKKLVQYQLWDRDTVEDEISKRHRYLIGI